MFVSNSASCAAVSCSSSSTDQRNVSFISTISLKLMQRRIFFDHHLLMKAARTTPAPISTTLVLCLMQASELQPAPTVFCEAPQLHMYRSIGPASRPAHIPVRALHGYFAVESSTTTTQ